MDHLKSSKCKEFEMLRERSPLEKKNSFWKYLHGYHEKSQKFQSGVLKQFLYFLHDCKFVFSLLCSTILPADLKNEANT